MVTKYLRNIVQVGCCLGALIVGANAFTIKENTKIYVCPSPEEVSAARKPKSGKGYGDLKLESQGQRFNLVYYPRSDREPGDVDTLSAVEWWPFNDLGAIAILSCYYKNSKNGRETDIFAKIKSPDSKICSIKNIMRKTKTPCSTPSNCVLECQKEELKQPVAEGGSKQSAARSYKEQ
jgi:hypothetical protein